MNGNMLNVRIQTHVLVGCLLVLPSCTHRSHLIKKEILVTPQISVTPTITQHTSPKPDIIVLIHGTKLLLRSFYYNYFNGTPCLKPACAFSRDTKIYQLLTQLASTAPEMFCYDNLYYFGWSGKLRVKERDKATKILYNQLVDLSEKYYVQHHRRPTICLIGHSHGGNLALTLARMHAQQQKELVIGSLITLACPVQLSTKDFVDSTLFKQIYSFYSTFDFVQVIAPEIAHYIHNEKGELICKKTCWIPFSSRRFAQRPHVKQARIKMNNRAPLHSKFAKADFLQTLPQVMHAVDDAYTMHTQELMGNKKEVLCAIKKSHRLRARA